jgi:hypothetical protein|tara:strand:- start:4779 stop:5018 length:240 start_codon:yes stop_codon:yes gene_type:complete
MAEYNHEINDKVYSECEKFLEETTTLGSWAETEQSHSNGFGTEEIAQGFVTEFEGQLNTSSISLAKLKEKLKEHYPNLK